MTTTDTDAFIQRWANASGTERANYQMFLGELAELLNLGRPDTSGDDTAENAYVFERRVTFRNGDGSESRGYIDLYKRGCFVCEAKQTGKELDSTGWDKAMLRARGQAEQYARALPASEGRPPFIIVTDVGRNIELYAEFSRSGATYTPFPDPQSHRIRLDQLADESIQQTLRAVWSDPLSLDPSRQSARVTREIADRLARLAKSLEGENHGADSVSAFLMRCLFTMFAEDVELLPGRSFTELLESVRDHPEQFPGLVTELWTKMNSGGFSAAIRADVLRFNGGLFAQPDALPLNKHQLDLLIEAARADWRHVEPAIFGTLLERALDPRERHKLGAHYTPRAYVERLVQPTVIEPLRVDWQAAQAAAFTLDEQGKHAEAVAEVRRFHRQLCNTRVLDPACGSGNFLYVTLEQLKRLEGEVLNTLHDMGESQGLLELEGVTVDPHQMLGIELNPRAARIAETVLWIGYLQWHFRTHGKVQPPQPVLRDFNNIECRDAVLEWDAAEPLLDANGQPQSRWDGHTTKPHPVTDQPVPDDTARVPLLRYTKPRKADWPQADFVVGNPPFIGPARMRQALGDGYVEALRQTYPRLPNSADFVMTWWHQAADRVRNGAIRRFGFITTNSLRQTFNRRVLQHHLDAKPPLSLRFAIPDHPWVDSADGAAVRIAMTVASGGEHPGLLQSVTAERGGDGEGREVMLDNNRGALRADLRVGVDLDSTQQLLANAGLSHEGVKLHGMGFVVTPEDALQLGLGVVPGLEHHIRNYLNGRDLAQMTRGVKVIDLYGLTAEEVRQQFPAVYQHVLERVKPERDQNNRATYRDNWWIFGEPRSEMRPALSGLHRYFVTVKTAKHRFFASLPANVIPDSKLIVFALNDAFFLGVMSSCIHMLWANGNGSFLEDRPTYVKTRCFDTFPFPVASDTQQSAIRQLAEEMDAHRKRQQAQHPTLTLTGCYNVLEKLRSGVPLTVKEQTIHQQGLVAVLKELHERLDEAVYTAYGWADLWAARQQPGTDLAALDEQLLERLVDLNRERAAEERRGVIHWLRPQFQNVGGNAQIQNDVGLPAVPLIDVTKGKIDWPNSMAEQVGLIYDVILGSSSPVTAEQLARCFKRGQIKRVKELLAALDALGKIREVENNGFVSI